VPVGEGPANQPDGFYNSLVEVTSLKLTERRTAMLNRMASVPDLTVNTVWPLILATLETNAADVPLAILYETTEIAASTTLRLRGQVGLPDGHHLLIDGADLASSDGLMPDCRRAGTDIVLIDCDKRFDNVSWHGFGAPSKKVGILPVTSGNRIFGYLIVGTNPYRPYDHACVQFLHDLRGMVSSVVTTSVHAAEMDKRQHQLEAELEDSDTKLRHLVEHASVGMVHMTVEGDVIWANDQYYALHGLPKDQQTGKLDFLDVYADEDRAKADQVWEDLKHGANHISMELRLKRFYTSPLGEQEHAHIQVLAFPYFENGKVKSIMAATTDISRLKWAQNFQARLAAEAREAKRQQEAFIDVVSHEMRNPLGAIVHCADEITRSLDECRSRMSEVPEPCFDALHDNVGAANIILQCASHQKRIIDDVLTLSKLDSMLLSITPTAIRPLKLINTITGIFEAELKSEHVAYKVMPDISLSQLNIDYLYLDPSRVTQIFINLVTNAIKFVKPSKDPTITIRYGASISEPKSFFPANMFWAPKGSNTADMTDNPEWGSAEAVYLTFMVQDTGIGMTHQEIHKIFERFRQANMRTHVKYGGSGLGLFISKELTEKQGGEIGVSSIPGEGSIFGFYIKTKRVGDKPKSLGNLPRALDGGSSQRLHVLLVEDNVINQQVLVRQLKKAGCFVDVANHGMEALGILESKGFDVILMDMEMPVMDGLATMREIRKRQREGKVKEHLPIIAVTANVRQEQIDHAMAAGAVCLHISLLIPVLRERRRRWNLELTLTARQDRVMRKPFKAVDLVHMMKGLVPQVKTPSSEPSTPGLIGPLSGMLL
jgi:PAS domain S-box-containing protein